MKFRYCQLLIQEFALRIDQSLILAILSFLREEKVCLDLIENFHSIVTIFFSKNIITPIINMDKDLEHIDKSLRVSIQTQTDTSISETQMYFDHIHLSPLKVSV